MITPNFNHEYEKEDGFGVVKGVNCDYIVQSPNQSLQLVPHSIGFNSSASTDANSVRISSIDDGQTKSRKISSNPKASKKKNSYHQHQGVKKPRLIWTDELHQHFLEIYNQFISPNEKLFPKKILEKMREKFPFITRENIASHLQKHRLSLKKGKNKEILAAKSSSKSVTPKIVKESNSQSTHNSNSTNPISTNPNSQLLNHEVCFQFDQTNHVSNQTTMQQPSLNNNVNGGTNVYSYIKHDVETQENPNWTPPIGQSSTNDLGPLRINLYPPPTSAHQFSNIDRNGNGYGFDPNFYGGLKNNAEDYILDTLPNFDFGDNMDFNFDNVQVGHRDHVLNNDMYIFGRTGVLDFGYPCQYKAINEFQMNLEQGIQSILCQSLNHMKGDSTSQQCFGSYNHLLPQTIENQWVEAQPNFTREE